MVRFNLDYFAYLAYNYTYNDTYPSDVGDFMPCGPGTYGLDLPSSWIFTIIVLLAIIGLMGNIYVVFKLFKVFRHNLVQFLVMNLAIADILFIFSIPLSIKNLNIQDMSIVLFICKLAALLRNWSVCCVTFILSVISVDRLLSVVKPLNTKQRRGKVPCIMLILWIIALLLAIPLASMQTAVQTGESSYCVGDHGFTYTRLLIGLSIVCVQFLIPLFIISMCNLGVLYMLLRKRISSRKAMVLMIIIIILFILLLGPGYIWTLCNDLIKLGIIADSCFRRGLLELLYWVSTFMAHCHSLLNPFIYGISQIQKNRKRGRTGNISGESLGLRCFPI